MEAIWQWGLNIIIAIQQVHGPALDTIFRAITFMGEEQFYLIALPIILWCFDYGFGAILAVFFMISFSINSTLKDAFQHPRPYQLNPSVKLSDADGYGLPSGHAQISLEVWTAIAARVRKAWFWVLAIVIILLISFSRIYLGVHFPTDVFGGWVVGGILLGLYFAFKDRLERWVTGLNMGFQFLLVTCVAILFLVPFITVDSLTGAGAFWGMGLGMILKRRYLAYDTGGPWWQRLLRYIIGVIVVLALYAGLKAIFPPDGTVQGSVFRFVRYTLMGAWITFGAIWFFKLVKVAK